MNRDKIKLKKRKDSDGKTALDLSYDISLESFKTQMIRLDTIDNKIQSTFNFALAFIVIAPTIVKGSSTKLVVDGSFISAMLLLTLACIISLVGRWWGEYSQPGPNKIYEHKLYQLETDEFKTQIIENAGISFEKNKALIQRKWDFNLLSLLLFGAALLVLIYWLSHQNI